MQGLNLRPMDSSQYSDPYIHIQYGKQTVDIFFLIFFFLFFFRPCKVTDRANYKTNQTNPIFGKEFSVMGTLPKYIFFLSFLNDDIQLEIIVKLNLGILKLRCPCTITICLETI